MSKSDRESVSGLGIRGNLACNKVYPIGKKNPEISFLKNSGFITKS